MDKSTINKSDTILTYGRGYVYCLQYHIVWCTKYRRKVLINKVEADLKRHLSDLSKEYNFTINAMEIMPDHIHMLISVKPQFVITDMMRILKGNTARWLFMEHPEIKKQLYGGHLWNPSYCVITVSDRSFDQVKEYINSQKER